MNSKGYIVADIGGTNARFAWVDTASDTLGNVQVSPCAEFPFLVDAIKAYIAGLGTHTISGVCLAVAGPVDTDPIDLPNNHWTFRREELAQSLGVPVKIINDFSAQVLSIASLESHELRWLGRARPSAEGVTAVIGPGTGLGVSALMPSGDILPSEAGHIGFAPVDQHQSDLLEVLRKRYQRVSAERILSGQGLANLYWANSHLQGHCRELPAAEVSAGARANDPLCRKAIEDFLAILAAFAGDVALMTGASRGAYISGGIVPRLLDFLDEDVFLSHFRAKGRFRDFNTVIPLAIVLAEQPGLRGCARALELEV
ncbi:MAG: glucokinase [Halioglobus sp.]